MGGRGRLGGCSIVNYKGLHCSQINWRRVRGERGGGWGAGEGVDWAKTLPLRIILELQLVALRDERNGELG